MRKYPNTLAKTNLPTHHAIALQNCFMLKLDQVHITSMCQLALNPKSPMLGLRANNPDRLAAVADLIECIPCCCGSAHSPKFQPRRLTLENTWFLLEEYTSKNGTAAQKPGPIAQVQHGGAVWLRAQKSPA